MELSDRIEIEMRDLLSLNGSVHRDGRVGSVKEEKKAVQYVINKIDSES